MQTQVMSDDVRPAAEAGPWLERSAAEGSSRSRMPLLTFPFTIGRLAPADLLVNSSRVSREHAVIVCENGKYLVRDRGSTNGTFVNGQRIQEVELQDGDTLVIADVEFTFGGSHPGAEQEATTQALRATGARRLDGLDLIRAVRRLHETVTQRCLPACYTPIVRLSDGQVVAYEALGADSAAKTPRELAEAECRLMLRLQHLQRLTAVEHAISLLDGATTPNPKLLVGVVPQELDAADLADSLLRLSDVVGRGRLVIELPDAAVSDAPMLRDLCGQLRAAEIGIAHVGFSAGGGQLRQRKEFAPDYLKLVGALSRELHHSGPHRRQVEEIMAAAQELGAQVIAAEVRREEEAEACRELGCHLAMGPYFLERDRQLAAGHGTAESLI
jgi:EAL domain-containing protein (putative c-di-GMP-specific phosphodiesterase class I)